MKQTVELLTVMLIMMLIVSCEPLSNGSNYSYDIDSFTVVGGPVGESTFIDEFDDGKEPPIGPSGELTYESSCASLSVDAESNGLVNLNKNDGCDVGDEFNYEFILNDNNFNINEDVGGGIEVKFKLENGIEQNSGIGILLFSKKNDSGVASFENLFMFVGSDEPDKINFSLDIEINDEEIDIYDIDISNSIIGVSDITLRLDISPENVVTGSVDFDSDGSFDVTSPETYTLTFMSGILGYAGGFDASFGK